MTEREQFLFDALCAIRKTVATRDLDSLVIDRVYDLATRAVRDVTKLPPSPQETAHE